jgi:hypothetical protein
MTLSYKAYTYPRHTTYYLTVDGIQFGSPYFSLKEVESKLVELEDKSLILLKWQAKNYLYRMQINSTRPPTEEEVNHQVNNWLAIDPETLKSYLEEFKLKK